MYVLQCHTTQLPIYYTVIHIHNIHSQQVHIPIKTNNDGKVVFFANAAVAHRKKRTNIEQG